MLVSRLVHMIHPDSLMFCTEHTQTVLGPHLLFTDHTLLDPDNPLDSDFVCNVHYRSLFLGLFSYEHGVKSSTAHYGNAEKFLLDIIYLWYTGQERHEQDFTAFDVDSTLG